MIPVDTFVQKAFQSVQPYAGINQVRKLLLKHAALVVLDPCTHKFLGILTPPDIVQRPHNLVIDCVTPKPMLKYGIYIREALASMARHNTEVLPFGDQQNFEGLIFKNDLINYLAIQNAKQKEQLKNDEIEIKKSDKILNAIYNNTHSVRLIIDPYYSIIFFNKTANEKAISFLQKPIKVGDNCKEYIDALLYADHHFNDDFKNALSGEHVVREKEITLDGQAIWIKTEYYAVYEEENFIGVSINSIDITERMKNEMIIKRQNKALRQISFFQSHEVRRPVANILGLVQLLDMSELKEQDKETIEHLLKTTLEFDSIIKKIVDTANFWIAHDME